MSAMTSNPSVEALSEEIDTLLARYLQLLDEYTSLRSPLNVLQSSIYTNIARANFQAERGVSYGQESYDRRAITPIRICDVTGDAEDGTAMFKITKPELNEKEKDGNIPSQPEDLVKGMESINIKNGAEENDSKNPPNPSAHTKTPDPLRLFGFSIPSALRLAQTSSIQMIASSIPELATVSLQMRALEIQIRRARKFRARAEAQAKVVDGGNGAAKVGVREGVPV